MNSFRIPLLALLLLQASVGRAQTATSDDTVTAETPAAQDPRARALLDEAKAKLKSVHSLIADFERSRTPTKNFDRNHEIVLERPNRFKVMSVKGAVVEERTVLAVSDGRTVTTLEEETFIAYEKPLRAENFFLGQNFLVQLFFDSRGIAFDPTDSTWGRPISQFDTNKAAYDKDTKLTYLGSRVLEENKYDVVEIKYNTTRSDIRQQIYIGQDKFVYQVDTSFDGRLNSQKFRNFRVDPVLPSDTWNKEKPEKMPLVASDPVRMGAEAPDFTLPGANGGEVTLKNLLAGKKGLYVCVLDGAAAKVTGSADTHLAQMRMLQEMKDKFESQGLAIVCIVGGSSITPDLKDEMMLNWMPDISRFNYPIAIDIDLEKGIQGSAYQNFQLNGRNNLLLDAKGRVVFGANNFTNKVNQLAFYQALAQIGFAVSSAELDSAAR